MAITGGRIWAASISINDLRSGAPTATTDLGSSVVAALPGELTVTGIFQSQTGAILPVGIHSVLLTDSSGALVSDFVTLTVTGGLLGGPSAVTLQFEDQTAAGFAAAVAGLQALKTPSVTVDGTLQDLSSILDSGALGVTVQTVSTVPDSGSTALLLGVGLLALGSFAKWRTFSWRRSHCAPD